MKRTLSIALAVLTIGLLGSCSKINERLDNLEKKVSGIENEQIASINSQISGITSSISDLGQIRSDISSLKQSASDHSVDIFNLEEADRALKDRILNLEDYVDAVLPNYAEREWVEATFSTLEQYEATCDTIAKIDARIGSFDAKLSKDIKATADSLTKWVNKQFEAYYTAAEMDAKLAQLKAAVDSAKASGGITDAKADSIATELTNAKAAVDTAKAAIRAEYRAAIDTAIKTSEGKLTKALNDAITEVNGKIESLTTRVGNLETSVNNLLGRVKALEEMIQSVVIVPAYSDGSVEIQNDSLYLDFIVSPSKAVANLEAGNVAVLVNKVKTKAYSGVDTIKIIEGNVFEKDDDKGVISVRVFIKNKIPAADSTITVAVKIQNGISDFTTEFVPVYVATKTFKAVYNTNGGANTLTFYYDDVDHSEEGIVYEDGTDKFLFDDTKTYYAKWGYNDKRGEIKSVVIDASVADYKGLTSTTFMFQGMAKATNISGAEYLDVSNVTDMTGMFFSFGSSLEDFNSVPDVSGWKTGSVTNMTSMFNSYGNNSTVLADVPDLSSWNTVKVTDMSNMFMSYGFKSKELNAVPKVGGWNTAEVENMTAMFKCFADSSTVLAVVPDVSNWNTGKVKKMGDMFFDYGRKSTALNTVPDVSGWNTINVETMTNMFQNYGYSSTALSTVPNVSSWKTSNVTKIGNLFKGYGQASDNIDCTLDLSGWDLSIITSGDDVFNFEPKTFNVTIPAKTGEKSNEGDKWYYGDGTNSIAAPAGKTFTPLPDGALNGVFSVSAAKKVRFSQGNLQATYNSSASTYTWGFAANQYDYIGNAAGNTTIDSQTNGAVVDFFGWSTDAASNNWGIHTKTSATDGFTTGNFKDWGKAIDDKDTWRTLSIDEWDYLINVNGDENIRKGKHKYGVTVCGKANCLILAPDDFEGTIAASYDATAWASAEAAGLVCLPAAGERTGSSVKSVGVVGHYWSSIVYEDDDEYVYRMFFDYSGVSPVSSIKRYYGYSVRLVTEVK